MDIRVVNSVRQLLNLPKDISDKEVINKVSDTFLVSSLKLKFAIDDFKKALKNDLLNFIKGINLRLAH